MAAPFWAPSFGKQALTRVFAGQHVHGIHLLAHAFPHHLISNKVAKKQNHQDPVAVLWRKKLRILSMVWLQVNSLLSSLGRVLDYPTALPRPQHIPS